MRPIHLAPTDRSTLLGEYFGAGEDAPASHEVNTVARGMTAQQIVDELPPSENEDVAAALRFAADVVADREIPLQPTGSSSSSTRTVRRGAVPSPPQSLLRVGMVGGKLT